MAIPGNLLSVNSESLETSATSWSILANLSAMVQSTDFALDGSHSLKCTATAAAVADIIPNTANQAYPLVTVGNTYKFFYACYVTAASLNATCVFDWYNGTTYVSTATGSATALVQNNWTWVSVQGAAPATSTLARIYPGWTATAASQLCYIDEIYFGPVTAFPSFAKLRITSQYGGFF